MAKLTCLSEVSVYTRNLKLSKEFYTKKIELKVREEDRKMGYLSLGATKGGEDAGLDLWQPDPKWGQEFYDQGVKVEKASDTFARFWDPDGNVLFVQQERRPRAKRAGLQSLAFVTVAVRD